MHESWVAGTGSSMEYGWRVTIVPRVPVRETVESVVGTVQNFLRWVGEEGIGSVVHKRGRGRVPVAEIWRLF